MCELCKNALFFSVYDCIFCATETKYLEAFFSQGACFVKNYHINSTCDIHTWWRDAKNSLLFKSC